MFPDYKRIVHRLDNFLVPPGVAKGHGIMFDMITVEYW